MNEDNLHSWVDPDLEARLVALVLGEASDFEREELERLIEEQPELAFFVKRIDAVNGLLHEIGSGGGEMEDPAGDEWKLPEDRRQELLAMIGNEPAEAETDSKEDAEPEGGAVVETITPPDRRGEKWKVPWARIGRLAALLCAAALILSIFAPAYSRRRTPISSAEDARHWAWRYQSEGAEADFAGEGEPGAKSGWTNYSPFYSGVTTTAPAASDGPAPVDLASVELSVSGNSRRGTSDAKASNVKTSAESSLDGLRHSISALPATAATPVPPSNPVGSFPMTPATPDDLLAMNDFGEQRLNDRRANFDTAQPELKFPAAVSTRGGSLDVLAKGDLAELETSNVTLGDVTMAPVRDSEKSLDKALSELKMEGLSDREQLARTPAPNQPPQAKESGGDDDLERKSNRRVTKSPGGSGERSKSVADPFAAPMRAGLNQDAGTAGASDQNGNELLASDGSVNQIQEIDESIALGISMDGGKKPDEGRIAGAKSESRTAGETTRLSAIPAPESAPGPVTVMAAGSRPLGEAKNLTRLDRFTVNEASPVAMPAGAGEPAGEPGDAKAKFFDPISGLGTASGGMGGGGGARNLESVRGVADLDAELSMPEASEKTAEDHVQWGGQAPASGVIVMTDGRDGEADQKSEVPKLAEAPVSGRLFRKEAPASLPLEPPMPKVDEERYGDFDNGMGNTFGEPPVNKSDEANLHSLFVREFKGGADNLRGFDFREVSPKPEGGGGARDLSTRLAEVPARELEQMAVKQERVQELYKTDDELGTEHLVDALPAQLQGQLMELEEQLEKEARPELRSKSGKEADSPDESRAHRRDVEFGFDYKSSQDSLAFQSAAQSKEMKELFDETRDVNQFSISNDSAPPVNGPAPAQTPRFHKGHGQVSPIQIEGNIKTKDDVIRRELAEAQQQVAGEGQADRDGDGYSDGAETHITSKLVEVKDEETGEMGFDWLLKQPPPVPLNTNPDVLGLNGFINYGSPVTGETGVPQKAQEAKARVSGLAETNGRVDRLLEVEPVNNEAVFESARAGSTEDYRYANQGINRHEKLSQDKSFSGRGRGPGQVSNGNLQAAEQLSSRQSLNGIKDALNPGADAGGGSVAWHAPIAEGGIEGIPGRHRTAQHERQRYPGDAQAEDPAEDQFLYEDFFDANAPAGASANREASRSKLKSDPAPVRQWKEGFVTNEEKEPTVTRKFVYPTEFDPPEIPPMPGTQAPAANPNFPVTGTVDSTSRADVNVETSGGLLAITGGRQSELLHPGDGGRDGSPAGVVRHWNEGMTADFGTVGTPDGVVSFGAGAEIIVEAGNDLTFSTNQSGANGTPAGDDGAEVAVGSPAENSYEYLGFRDDEKRAFKKRRTHTTTQTDFAAFRVSPPAGLDEKDAAAESFSTFSLHVSDVSFKLAQAALANGEWPEAEKIRIEEFVNAFDYGDPMPSQDDRVACNLEQAAHPFLQQRNLLRVSMKTAAAGRAGDTPLRLTFLLDNSGSMERSDRQETVRRAFALLADQLQPIDQVTLISFARQPRLIADKVSGDKSRQLVDVVGNTPSEGGTNIEAALQLAFEKAQEQKADNAQNRIVLLTDGAANLGNAKPESLARTIESMRNEGIAFDAAGIGADGLNDEILEALTRKGDGRYYLLDRPEDADAGFARQIAGALRPAAKNVKVQVEFNPDRVGKYKLLGFEKHRLKKEDFRNDAVDAAEMAAEEAGVAVYQFEAKPGGQGDIGFVSVRFQDLSSGEMVEKRWPIPYRPNAPRPDQASPSLQIATAAALLGAKLKGGSLGETVELDELAQIVSALPEHFQSRERVRQLRQMIEQARQLESP